MGAIDDIVTSVIRERLSGVTIESIEVEPDVGIDGDPILRITVVFPDAEGPELDPEKLVTIPRHLRSELKKLDVDRFPILSFISRGDAKKLKEAI